MLMQLIPCISAILCNIGATADTNRLVLQFGPDSECDAIGRFIYKRKHWQFWTWLVACLAYTYLTTFIILVSLTSDLVGWILSIALCAVLAEDFIHDKRNSAAIHKTE
jgi:hypothetical protein